MMYVKHTCTGSRPSVEPQAPSVVARHRPLPSLASYLGITDGRHGLGHPRLSYSLATMATKTIRNGV